ncbi:hypothetical protein PI125_g2057 [Phytophthora idaei]|nr:hypothetical protein PI125_g2057 [Phytophthora idaei]KAG3171426.1 hypothetical protein PI126_g1871 [Phytophthora idaei]
MSDNFLNVPVTDTVDLSDEEMMDVALTPQRLEIGDAAFKDYLKTVLPGSLGALKNPQSGKYFRTICCGLSFLQVGFSG